MLRPRNLHVTSVVPLARRSGLIEWCEGTIPLGDWLANENTGAHQRYHPTDLSPNQAKLKLAGARDKPPERRMAIFSEICSKIRWQSVNLDVIDITLQIAPRPHFKFIGSKRSGMWWKI
ncbi:unnamed protein product [Rodentolepis nana]|uniref:PID domain-containing protein n=1 Tax=Rodentolepis nana TaxID=102285 RepID=A0A0R3U059_RODNA|nr:unnamed protein product [Rodentolepis nana]